jgi:hypothetical protein
MGTPLTPKTSDQTRHGLIALVAIRQARAIRERKQREAAERQAKEAAGGEHPPGKRGWFR